MLANVVAQVYRGMRGVPVDSTEGIAFLWFLVMVFNVVVAKGKNRSPLVWFFLSVFLGPIATFLLIVVLDRLPDSEEGR